MGYTHYYRTKPELDKQAFENIQADFKKMIPIMEHLGVKLGDGFGENTPLISPEEITFNGLVQCGHQKEQIGLAWPSPTAKGVKADHTFMQLSEMSKGEWFAGKTLEMRVCGGDCSYETFSLDQSVPKEQLKNLDEDGYYFNCTKTNYKPYDLAVNVCLIIAKHYLKGQIKITSDGNMDNWIEGIQLCEHFLGYGEDFHFGNNAEERALERKPEATLIVMPEERRIDKTKPVEVGDIFERSWGYDQTNVDFYKVVGLTKSGKSARVIKIGQKVVKQTGDMSELVAPDPDRIIGEKPNTYRIYQARSDSSIYIGHMWRWDGTPCHQSHYA